MIKIIHLILSYPTSIAKLEGKFGDLDSQKNSFLIPYLCNGLDEDLNIEIQTLAVFGVLNSFLARENCTTGLKQNGRFCDGKYIISSNILHKIVFCF